MRLLPQLLCARMTCALPSASTGGPWATSRPGNRLPAIDKLVPAFIMKRKG